MELFVYSRSAIEAIKPHEVPHVIISITCHSDDRARLRLNEACLGVLRLAFVDVEAPSKLHPEASLFSGEHAKEVWAFVHRHFRDVQRIIVHCDAGVSRSSAGAAALARVLKDDDAEFFAGRHCPNMRVYRTLLETADQAWRASW